MSSLLFAKWQLYNIMLNVLIYFIKLYAKYEVHYVLCEHFNLNIYFLENSVTCKQSHFLVKWISSVAQSCPTLCDPMNHSTLGLPLHHQLPESTQTHVHWIHDAIQPSHPLSSPSLPPLNLSQHQGLPMSQLFASGGQSIGVSASISILPVNIQDWLHLGWTGWISLQSKGLSRVFSNTTIQKHQFFSAQLSPQSNSYIHIWPLEKP